MSAPHTDPAALADELERRHNDATPLPWLRVGTPWARQAVLDTRQTELCDAPYERTADMDLVVALRNSLPEIIAYLRSLAELREQREGGFERGRQKGLDEASLLCAAREAERYDLANEQREAGWEHAANRYADLGDEAGRCAGDIDELRVGQPARSTASPAPGKEDQALTNNRPKGA